MPNKVAILTDSTAYLPEEYVKQHNITITPLSVIWGNEIYRDGMDILPNQFYKRLAESKVMPTTSPISPAAFQSAFQSLLERGWDVLGIFVSSKISGTFQSAVQARELISGAANKIALVDSLWTMMAMGWPVLTAARAELNPVETLCCPLSPVVGTHAGPGTVALNYLSDIA